MKKTSKWMIAAGVLLLTASLCFVAVPEILHYFGAQQAAKTVAQIEATLPPRTGGVQDSYRVMQMPVLNVEGKDFVAVLEIPTYGVVLPVGNEWNTMALYQHPCRFDGTAYDGSLMIGGSCKQLTCLKEVQNGDVVRVTDMQGAIYTYTVSRIHRADHADKETLNSDAALTLFAQDAANMEYVIVECE